MASSARPTVFFLSDFGVADAYVGIVKGVIRGIAPHVDVLDLAHELPPQDLRCGAYQLYEAAPYLPDGSVVLAVVDPGVGSARRAVAAEGRRHTWVAPDNGLLSLAFTHDPPVRAHALESDAHRLPRPSHTFHGRDVFGPAAAYLAAGEPLHAFGPAVPPDELSRLGVTLGDGPAGEILTFDRFGNAITTLRGTAGFRALQVGSHEVGVHTHYAEVGPGEPLALVGSAGLLEVSARNDSAQARMNLHPGMPVHGIG